jgi:ferric iron reductase protein FhuF
LERSLIIFTIRNLSLLKKIQDIINADDAKMDEKSKARFKEIESEYNEVIHGDKDALTNKAWALASLVQAAKWIFMAVLPPVIARNIVKDMRLDIMTKGHSIYEGNSEVIYCLLDKCHRVS